MTTVQQLFDAAFAPERYRDPRSSAYKNGVMAGLQFRINHVKPVLPYKLGTAEADAWFAGTDEGNRIGGDPELAA